MHQIVCRLGLCPRPRWGSLQRFPDPSWILGGLLLRGRGGTRGNEKKGEGRVRARRGGKGKRGGEGRVKGGMGRDGAESAPKLKLGPPRTIFLAPALFRPGMPANIRPHPIPVGFKQLNTVHPYIPISFQQSY